MVVRPSDIEGQGLFAATSIGAGQILVRLGGRLVSSAELARLLAKATHDPEGVYVDAITVYEDAHLVLPSGSVVHFGNHSCDPNAWLVGPYEIAGRRDIPAGEEITIDYGTLSGAYGYSMECRCGSSICRGRVTSEDWRLPELQARYRDHWVPALAERIAGGYHER